MPQTKSKLKIIILCVLCVCWLCGRGQTVEKTTLTTPKKKNHDATMTAPAPPSCATPWLHSHGSTSAALPDADDHGIDACPTCGLVLDSNPLAAGAAATRDAEGERGGVYVGPDGNGAGAGERERGWRLGGDAICACWRRVHAFRRPLARLCCGWQGRDVQTKHVVPPG